MAGAFLAGGSAAPIAAFTAIAWPEAETVCTRSRGPHATCRVGCKGRSKAEDGAGQLFCFAMQSRPSAKSIAPQRDGQKLGAAAENSCPAPLQTGSGRRLLALTKDQPPPGASGRSPLGKAAARLFPARAQRRRNESQPSPSGAAPGEMSRDHRGASRRGIGTGSARGRTGRADPRAARACRRRRGGRGRG